MSLVNDRIIKAIESLENEAKEFYLDYKFYGIRFDRRHNLEEGYELECSKSNRNREDAREFPLFGTPEYEEMEILDGTCAYFVFDGESEKRSSRLKHILNNYTTDSHDFSWYLIGSDKLSDEDGEDEDEIIMIDAIVVKKL